MQVRLIGKVVLCAGLVAVGGLMGIWADWSEWLSGSSGQNISYVIRTFGTANLEVDTGDVITLKGSQGGTPPTMHFLGNFAPCNEANVKSKCTIDGKHPGPYYFSCSANPSGDYSCPDPAIQQRTGTTPVWKFPLPFFVALRRDVDHIFGGKTFAEERALSTNPDASNAGATMSSPTSKAPGAGTNATTPPPIGAYVVCDPTTPPGQTEVYQLSTGAPGQITVKQGQQIVWVSPDNFSLTLPAKFCANPSSTSTRVQCTVAAEASSNAYSYTASTSASISGCKDDTSEKITVSH